MREFRELGQHWTHEHRAEQLDLLMLTVSLLHRWYRWIEWLAMDVSDNTRTGNLQN